MTLKNKTILIVDDDAEILLLLSRILTPTGLNVLSADSAEEARKLLPQVPHLILSDLNMYPEDGFSFIQSVKSEKKYQHIPILVLSALNDFASVKKAISLGVKDYVLKPIQPPMLLRKLRKAFFNQDYLRWDVPADQMETLELPLPGTITHLGETGFKVTGSFKLKNSQEVEISCPLFRQLKIDKLSFRTTDYMQTYKSEGNFSNDVYFLGVGENQASEIRKYLMRKKP